MSVARKILAADVVAAVESLYEDEVKPFGWILRRRCTERVFGGRHSGGSSLDVDFQDLRNICKECEQLRVKSKGGKWFVLLKGRPPAFVDFYCSRDPYAKELWQQLKVHFQGSKHGGLLPLDGTGRYATALSLQAQNLPFLSGRSLGELCHIVQLAVSRKLLEEPDCSVFAGKKSTHQAAKSVSGSPMPQQTDVGARESFCKTSTSHEYTPGSLTISTLVARSKIQDARMIPKPLKHKALHVPEACRRLSLEHILDRTQFADKALQNVKNTFIHFPDKSLQACHVRRSASIPKNFGSCKDHGSLSPRSDLPDHSPTNSGRSKDGMASMCEDFSPMSATVVCCVSSSVSTADNTPTNSDEDGARYGQQPPCAVELPAHSRMHPWEAQSPQHLMKLRATGQALMLELKSKTDLEGQFDTRSAFVQAPSSNHSHSHQCGLGLDTSQCHNKYAMHWVFQPVY